MVPRSTLYFARLPSPVPPVRRWPKGPSTLPSPARWQVRRLRCVAAPLPQKGSLSFPWDKQKSPKENFSLGVNNWKVLTDAAWRIGAKGLESIFLKGGSALTVKTIYESITWKAAHGGCKLSRVGD